MLCHTHYIMVPDCTKIGWEMFTMVSVCFKIGWKMFMSDYNCQNIVTIGLDRVITSWNKDAENLYGYPVQEVIGKHLSVVMLPGDIKSLIDKVNDLVNEITVHIYETVCGTSVMGI